MPLSHDIFALAATRLSGGCASPRRSVQTIGCLSPSTTRGRTLKCVSLRSVSTSLVPRYQEFDPSITPAIPDVTLYNSAG